MQPNETSGVATGAGSGVANHLPEVNQNQAVPTQPASTGEAAPPSYRPQTNGPSRADLLAAIDALPERLSQTFREITAPKPAPTPPAEKTETKVETPPANASKQAAPPQRGARNLREWYTGEIRG